MPDGAGSAAIKESPDGAVAAAYPDIMTAPQAAEYMQLPLATLYGWRVKNVGPPAHKVGKHLRYVRREVDAWLSEQ